MGFDPFKEFRKKRARQQQEFAERERKNAEARMRERAFAAYVTSGGTARGFEDEWPSLRSELLKNAVLERTEKK